MSFPSLSFLFSADPLLRYAQIGIVVLGLLDVFLILFVMRDIILRTRSFGYQLLSILLVALLPFVGFFLYLLIRPARMLKEREMEALLKRLVADELPMKSLNKEASKP